MTKRILVVEDQEDNRRIIRDLHTERGYRTACVGPEHLATPPFPRSQALGYPGVNP
jgi:CheY-like chemotaxis protein